MALQMIKWRKRDNLGRQRETEIFFEVEKGRIVFVKSDFAFKDQIKAMRGAKYHGFDAENPRRIWSVEDCARNRAAMRYLAGENIYAWFDRELVRHEYTRPLLLHQHDMSDAGLTYHYQIWAAEMGVGKTLSAQEVIEKSGKKHWFWVGPKSSLQNIEREFKIWGFPYADIDVQFMTYDRLVKFMDDWRPGDPIPDGVIFDESSKLKTWSAQRTQAAAKLTELIRSAYGYDGYAILMSGTPSPKTPVDWWAQAEVAYPGFLAEGDDKAFKRRLAFMQLHQFASGVSVNKVEGWRDDEKKCKHCGQYEDHINHDGSLCESPEDFHAWEPSVNEVALIPRRLKGLVVIKHKKDCLDLPEKRFRRIYCKPHPSTLRVAQAISAAAPTAIWGLTALRELSDGFQYREVKDGVVRCQHCVDGLIDEWFDRDDPERTYQAIDLLDPEVVSRLEKRQITCPACNGSQEVPRFVRETKHVPCPKDKALKMLLEENEEQGRIVIFAGFTGSVDRCEQLCHEEGWDVVRCDGRGYQVTTYKDEVVTDEKPLDYWANFDHPRVAYVAHPESGGMSLTLTEARMAVYWSNSWKPEYRVQSMDRIHRLGMDVNAGCWIVDLIHLPTDERVLDVIHANRRLELMSMGEICEGIDWTKAANADDDYTIVDVSV